MKKIKLLIYILFFCLISLLFTGCNNYNELNNVTIVDGIGIDKINDEYQVSFNTYISNDEYQLYTINDTSLNNIFNDIYQLVNKKIYLSHLNVLALSSNLENRDIIEIINTFNDHNDLRGSFNVVLIHNYNNKIFSNTSSKIAEILENNNEEIGYIYPTTFNDIINDYLKMDISYIPILNSENLKIMGMHSIISEYRFYNNEESLLLNLLTNKTNNTSFVINKSDVKINDVNITYKVNKNKITIDLDLSYISEIDKDKIRDYLYDEINNFLSLDINYNYFNNLIKMYNYEYYKNYKNISISFDININLNRDEINNMKEGVIDEKDSQY